MKYLEYKSKRYVENKLKKAILSNRKCVKKRVKKLKFLYNM